MLAGNVVAWAAVGALVAINTFALAGRLKSGKTDLFFAAVFLATVSGGLAWWCMTVFSPVLIGTWIQLAFICFLSVPFVGGNDTSDMSRPFGVYGAMFLGVAVSGAMASAPIFHAERYGSLVVPTIEERDATVPLIDQTQARIVTDGLALKRAAEILATSNENGLGSRVEMGAVWGNKVGGTMYWIMPLEHSGFWKWYAHGTTPGYIAVSQMNEMDTRFVQDKPLKIGVKASFDDNVYRHLFNRGFKNEIMGEAIFQVDEEWNPYWVVPMYLPQIGVGGEMPVSWSIVDAVTGDVQTYQEEADVPAWVDRLYHQDMIAERFNDWGCWSNGVAACMFTGKDVLTTTSGINVTIDANLDIIYYSGTQFQNSSSEGATSGFFTANARTGEITFYRRAGISESAARAVMNGAYADYENYYAADSVLLSLNGKEVFFSVILDGNGSRKGFALVLQTNRNVFGKGNSIQAALTDFGRSLQRAGRDAGLSSGVSPEGIVHTGIVSTMMAVVQNERTSFYMTLDSIPGKIIEVSEEKIGEIVVTKVGDRISFTTDNDQPGVIFATSFDNLGFKMEEGPIMEQRFSSAEGGYQFDETNARRARQILDRSADLSKDASPIGRKLTLEDIGQTIQ